MMKNNKKEIIEKTTNGFLKMGEDNKMLIIGYMLGVEHEKQKTTVRHGQSCKTKIMA